MDSVILFNILEYIDKYDINNIFRIKPYEVNIQDIIDIEENNQSIEEELLKEKWENKYTFDVIFELKMIYFYLDPIIINHGIIYSNILKNKELVKQKKIICYNIKHLFYNNNSKILQSRLPLKYLIKYQNSILMPVSLGLDFILMREVNNFKFLE
jgi:hypothetical protein